MLTRRYKQDFLLIPTAKHKKAGLTEEECEALANIDRVGLELAAKSFARKRTMRELHPGKGSWVKYWRQFVHARFR